MHKEVRFCLEYRLAADGPAHAVQTAWMVDSPATRAQIDEMIANARAMNAFASKWWIEERQGGEAPR
ncbi:hypothetical protein [Acidovorax cavernicola]|uniref:Uncharacterized protein n=1 Tax=Acidovorax cavernicola TaxID=1675792 RepID=A0A9X8D7Q1_9BURK|nr:hypothetical protein [Acidovorax cavernicola]RIX83585.1 hypothetical protein D3H34_06210 [Acidovorax cavernicola]